LTSPLKRNMVEEEEPIPELERKKKTREFSLDFKVNMREYNGLSDKHLRHYFEKKEVKRILKKAGIKKG